MTKIACRARLVIHSRTATVLTVFSALSVVAFFTSSPAHATTYIYTGSGISIGASVTIDAAPDATGTFGATSESISGPVPIVPIQGSITSEGASLTLDNGVVDGWDLYFSYHVLGSATSLSVETTPAGDSFFLSTDSGQQSAQGHSGVWTCEDCGMPSTPLPAALPLFATGLGGLGLFGWRRKRKVRQVCWGWLNFA